LARGHLSLNGGGGSWGVAGTPRGWPERCAGQERSRGTELPIESLTWAQLSTSPSRTSAHFVARKRKISDGKCRFTESEKIEKKRYYYPKSYLRKGYLLSEQLRKNSIQLATVWICATGEAPVRRSAAPRFAQEQRAQICLAVGSEFQTYIICRVSNFKLEYLIRKFDFLEDGYSYFICTRVSNFKLEYLIRKFAFLEDAFRHGQKVSFLAFCGIR
jgi:hypothetical protein